MEKEEEITSGKSSSKESEPSACIPVHRSPESSDLRMTRLFSSIKKALQTVHGRRFVSRFGTAVRTGWACLLAGLVLEYGRPLNQWMAVPFFSLVICIGTVEATIGEVLWNVVGVFLGMLQALLTGFIVFLFLGPSLSLGPTILCVFVGCFCVQFPAGMHKMARKVALAEMGIVFITAHSGVNNGSMIFLLRLALTTAVGAACSTLALLLPFPGLAMCEARLTSTSAARASTELFKTLTDAFCTKDANTFTSIMLHAQFLLKTTTSILGDMKSREECALSELRFFGRRHAFKRLTRGLTSLKLHLLGMTLALQSGLVDQSPRKLSTYVKDAVEGIGQRTNQLLALASQYSSSPTLAMEKQELLQQSKEELKCFDQILTVAREAAYYDEFWVMTEEQLQEKSLPSSKQQGDCLVNTQPTYGTMIHTYFLMFNLRLYFTEVMKMVDSGKMANKMQQFSSSASKFWIQNPPAAGWTGIEDFQPPTAIPSSSPCSTCIQASLQDTMPIVIPSISSTKWFCRRMLQLCLGPDFSRFIRAAKIASAMSIAAVLGVSFNKQYAFWANISIGFIIQNHQGGSFRMANLRLQGTVIGGMYGYLAILLTKNDPVLILLVLIPFVVLLSYMRFSRIFGYAGVLAGLTAAIIMLGGKQQGIQEFALVRITENFIGVTVFALVETLVFPNRAVTLSRQELVSSLINLRDCVAIIISGYTGHYCPEHCRLLSKDIKLLEQQLRSSIALQRELQTEAVLEPDLWNAPFPAEIYCKLVNTQSRMLDLLYFMVCSLHAATEDSSSEQVETLLEPLLTSLVALEEEVLSSLDLLQELLRVNKPKLPALKRKVSSLARNRILQLFVKKDTHDVENQLNVTAAGNDDAFHKVHSLVGLVHPLLVLEGRQRAMDGTPLSVQSTLKAFQNNYEDVIAGLIAKKRAQPEVQILSNTVMLSFSALSFSLQSLLKEIVELEKGVHELLHTENPWRILDLHVTFTPASTNVQSKF